MVNFGILPKIPKCPTPKHRKANTRRCRVIASCDRWVGPDAFCRYCDEKLDTEQRDSPFEFFESHLLFVCEKVPGNGPLANDVRPPERDLMRRLAEIGAVIDPGGVG